MRGSMMVRRLMRIALVRVLLGAGKNLGDVNGLHARELPMQRAAEMHQATVVERGAILGVGREHVVQLGVRACRWKLRHS